MSATPMQLGQNMLWLFLNKFVLEKYIIIVVRSISFPVYTEHLKISMDCRYNLIFFPPSFSFSKQVLDIMFFHRHLWQMFVGFLSFHDVFFILFIVVFIMLDYLSHSMIP